MPYKYRDRDDSPRSIYWMLRNEPEWAASRIKAGEDAIAECDRLREALEECEVEIDNYINAVYQYPTKRKDNELALNPARLALKGDSDD